MNATPGWSAVLFDCDGLLADTEPLWSVAMATVLDRYDVTTDVQALGEELTGVSVQRTVQRLHELIGLSTLAEEQVETELLQAYAHTLDGHAVPPNPGVRSLVERLAGRVPLAVVSNSPEDAVLSVLKALGLADLFSVVVCAHGVCAPKPDPAPYLRACAALGVFAADCVAFEDSPSGATAAAAAGLTVYVVPSPGTDVAAFPAGSRVLSSLKDVAAQW